MVGAVIATLLVTACGSAPPSVAPPTARPTPVITPDPHLTEPATADQIFVAIRVGDLPLNVNNATSGDPTSPIVKRINAAIGNWPLIITEFRSSAALREATKWDATKPPTQGNAPYTFVGLNILIEFGPITGVLAAPDADRQKQAKVLDRSHRSTSLADGAAVGHPARDKDRIAGRRRLRFAGRVRRLRAVTTARPRASGRTGDEVSDLDKRIIEHLQQDGRRPFTQIAAELGVSEAAVRARTNRLVDRGILQVVGVTDPLKLGFQQMAMIGIRCEADRLMSVAARVAEFAEVDYVVITAGTYDILIETVCEDNEGLLRFLAERLRTIEGVRDTETFVYLRMVKQSYQWGTR